MSRPDDDDSTLITGRDGAGGSGPATPGTAAPDPAVSADEPTQASGGVTPPPGTTAAQAAGWGGDPAPIQEGSVLGHTYEIESVVARGGMGRVYRARHTELGTTHAIKVILPEYARDAAVVELFRREATVLRQVRHDAVVAYDGINRDAHGRLYLVMEFVEGPSLARILRDGPLGEDDAVLLLERMTSGLAAAHAKGVVHRDLSPDNVILPDGRIGAAKIIDFGISKQLANEAGTIIGDSFAGKFSYAAPEQFGLFGAAVDGRTDLYSAGLVMVEAVRGSRLDMGSTAASAIQARMAVPDLSEVPARLRPVLAAMLAPDPKDRPADVAALLALLPRPAGGTAAGSATPERKTEPGLPLGRIAAAVVVAAALGGGAYAYLAGGPPPPTGPDRIAAAPAPETTPAVSGPAEPVPPEPTPEPTPEPPPQATAPEPPAPAPPAPEPPAPEPPAPEPPVQLLSKPEPAAPPAEPPPQTPTAAPVEAEPATAVQTAVLEAADTASAVAQPAVAEPGAGPVASVATPAEPPRPVESRPDPLPVPAPPPAPQTAPAPVVVATPRPPSLAEVEAAVRRALPSLSCAGVTVVQGSGGFTLTGFVGTAADAALVAGRLAAATLPAAVTPDIAVRPWPFCEALAAVSALSGEAVPAGRRLRLAMNKPSLVYRNGEILKVTVQAGTAGGHLSVDYYDLDGHVIHLVPMPLRRDGRVAAGQAVTLGGDPNSASLEERVYTVSEPFGPGMIVAVLTEQPLFAPDRPEVEDPRAYLEAFRAALAKARAAGGAIAADTRYFETRAQ